jgi:nucleotide-binding universal stress UspA family protein
VSADAPAVSQAQIIVGFDGSAPALRALDNAVKLLMIRPGRIIVLWVAHLTSSVELSADAIAIVESDFDKVAAELRGTAAERLEASRAGGATGVPWEFMWRQGAIAAELVAEAESRHAAHPDDVVAIMVGSSSSAMHRVVGSVAVSLARHSPVPVMIVP